MEARWIARLSLGRRLPTLRSQTPPVSNLTVGKEPRSGPDGSSSWPRRYARLGPGCRPGEAGLRSAPGALVACPRALQKEGGHVQSNVVLRSLQAGPLLEPEAGVVRLAHPVEQELHVERESDTQLVMADQLLVEQEPAQSPGVAIIAADDALELIALDGSLVDEYITEQLALGRAATLCVNGSSILQLDLEGLVLAVDVEHFDSNCSDQGFTIKCDGEYGSRRATYECM